MIKAGLGTAPQKSLFRKLDRLTGSGGAGAPAWFLSHPPAAPHRRDRGARGTLARLTGLAAAAFPPKVVPDSQGPP